MAGVVAQVILGGITVLVDLHPLAVQGHMLLSLVLVATSVVLLRRAGEPDGQPRRVAVSARSRALVWMLAGVTGVAIVAGTVVTGAGPHAGDEDVQRFDVDIAAAARVHGTTVTIAVAIAVVLALLVQRSPRDRDQLQGPLSSWIFVAVLQAAVGYVQYFNAVPPLLVGIHVAGATALWAMTVWLVLSTTSVEPAVRGGDLAPAVGLVPSAPT